VAGVVEVNGLLLFSVLSDGTYQPLPVDSNNRSELTLTGWQLPELLQVSVATGADGSGVMPNASLAAPVATGPNTVAVPIVSTLC
jgi:hypothetical protein